MTRLERNANLAGVVLPFAATLLAIALLWGSFVGAADLAILAVMYLITATGVTVGYHRLLTHRAFRTTRPIRYALAIMGSLSVQGSVLDWVADHRRHHAHTDREGDPHSPHVSHGSGTAGVLRGLWHAHTGWLLVNHGQADWKRFAFDLHSDRGMRRINRRFPLIALAGLVVPAAAGYLIGGTVTAALSALLWGGFVRIFLVHHVTWSVNSICHFFGSRRFDTDDRSTNVSWLALPSLGESWHHNHHAFPRSAKHGLRWFEIDPSAMLIAALERLGLAWDVVRITPERQRERLAGDS